MATRAERTRPSRERLAKVLVVVLAALAGLVAGVAGEPRDDASASRDDGPSGGGPGTTAPGAQAFTFLFGHVAAGGAVDVLSLVGYDPATNRASVLLVPTATLVEVPSLGTQTLADAHRFGGGSLLEASVENAFGVRVDRMLLAPDDLLARLFVPVVELEVDLRRAVTIEDSGGELGFAAGEQTISASDGVRLLVGRNDEGELAHLVTVQAVLDSFRRTLRDDSVAAAVLEVSAEAEPFARVAAAELRFDTLPVDSVSTAGDERFGLRREAAADLFERSFPYALLGDGDRPKVEVLNGTGAVGITQAVAARIVPAGGEITLTGNVPGFGVTETVVVYYRDASRTDAERMAEALGVGRVAKGSEPIAVVDLTIVVGADFQAGTS